MPPAPRRTPRRVNRENNPNLLRSTPIVEDEPTDFIEPKSASESSSIRDEIKDATEAEYRPGKYHAPVMKFYGYAALGLMPFLPETAKTLAVNANDCAEEWDKLSRRNPQVKRMLEFLTQNTGRFALAAAHTPILVAAARETGTADKILKSTAVQRIMQKFMPRHDVNEAA